MFEIEMNDTMYQFNFGYGFLSKVNKRVMTEPDQNGVRQKVGINYVIGGVLAKDCESLVDTLLIANEGFTPRITTKTLTEYIDSPNTDIDKLYVDVMNSLREANAFRDRTKEIEKAIEEERQKQQAGATEN